MTKGQRAEGPKWTFVVCCALFILALLLLWPVVRHPGWWIWTPGVDHSDLAVTHWPNAHFTRRSLWEDGQFPLWRPTIMSGTPFAANPLAGLYYPPNWFFLFLPWLPLEVGFNLSALVHLWLAGAAMYALLRRGFGISAWGASVAAVIYEASPKLLAHLGTGHVGWVQAWGWLPVVMLCWLQVGKSANQRVSESAGLRANKWTVGAGVALAMQFCADVRMAAYTLIAMASLMLVLAIRRSLPIIRYSLFVIRLFLIFLGLTACQWLPMVALLPETTRASMTLRDAAAWSLPWQYLAGLLLANHGGFHEWMTYVGVGTLVLAGVGAKALLRERRERWRVVWLASLAVGAAWFSLGENGGLFQVLWRVVPGLGMLRVPPRAWVLVVFAMAVLAGFGVEEAQGRGDKETRRRKRGRQMFSLVVGMFPPLLVLGYWLSVGVPPLNLVMFGVVTPLVAAGCNVRSATRNLQWRGLAIVLLVVVDLIMVDVTLIEARPPEEVFADGRSAAEWLAAQPGHFRVYSPSYSIPQHVAERYGLALADGVDPLQLRAYANYLTRAAGLEPWKHPYTEGYSVTLPPFPPDSDDVRSALADMIPNLRSLKNAGVRYIVTAFPLSVEGLLLVEQFEQGYIYRIELVDECLWPGESRVDSLAIGTPDHGFSGWCWCCTWYPLKTVRYTPNEVVFKADGMEKIHFSGVWSTGWQVWVNGERKFSNPEFFANGVFFRNMIVWDIYGNLPESNPSWQIEIAFVYRPWSVYAGWAVSGVTVFVVLLGCWIGESRRRRADG